MDFWRQVSLKFIYEAASVGGLDLDCAGGARRVESGRPSHVHYLPQYLDGLGARAVALLSKLQWIILPSLIDCNSVYLHYTPFFSPDHEETNDA
jgi:hypothetical protein